MNQFKIIIATQSDTFVIPTCIERVFRSFAIDIQSVIVIDGKESLRSKALIMWKRFGSVAIIKLALKTTVNKGLDIIDQLTGRLFLSKAYTIQGFCKKNKIEFIQTNNINQKKMLEKIQQYAPDTLVSFSAPQVFKPALLAIPKYGCINLHCSLIPKHRGLLPSFWALYFQDDFGGATVHMMGEGIDDGDILNQEKICIKHADNMYDVIQKTKHLGTDLMIKTLHQMMSGTLAPLKNVIDNGNYNHFPTQAEANEFRRRGYRLI